MRRWVDLLPSERHLCLGLVDSVKESAQLGHRNGSARFDVHFDSDYNASSKTLFDNTAPNQAPLTGSYHQMYGNLLTKNNWTKNTSRI